MNKLIQNLNTITKQEFQKYFETPMTDEDSEEIKNNLVSLFELLISWQEQMLSNFEVQEGRNAYKLK